MPYASRLRMFFGRGLENPAGLRCIFIRGMGNRVGIGPRFVRGMDFLVGIRFIRPLAWPFVGRIQYAPTLTDEILSIFLPIQPLAWPFVGRMLLRPTRMIKILSIFSLIRPLAWPSVGRMLLRPTRIIKNRPGIGFVFRGVAEKGAGRGLCEKWGRRASIIIRRLLPLRARRRMGPIIAPAHAFIIPNYVA